MAKSLKEQAIDHINRNLKKDSRLYFKDGIFDFYWDLSGQRGHKISEAVAYGKKVRGLYMINRVLSFTNKGDEGKDDAILGILNLNKDKLVSISEKDVIFEMVRIVF